MRIDPMSAAPVPGGGELVVIRLLRRWAACRDAGELAMPSMVGLAHELGASAQAAVALASLFQLTEGMIGRPLVGACCCDSEPSADERAVFLLLAHAPESGPIYTSRAVPHGLAGPLAWAALSVHLALGLKTRATAIPAACPFARQAPELRGAAGHC